MQRKSVKRAVVDRRRGVASARRKLASVASRPRGAGSPDLASLLAGLFAGGSRGPVAQVSGAAFVAAAHAARGPDAADRAVLQRAVDAGFMRACDTGNYLLTDDGWRLAHDYAAAAHGGGSTVPASDWVDALA